MHVVLLYEKYYEDMKEPIYKLGMSNLRLNTKSIANKVVYYETCNDIGSIEEMMRNKYIHRLDIGNNYYYGDLEEMILDIVYINERKICRDLIN